MWDHRAPVLTVHLGSHSFNRLRLPYCQFPTNLSELFCNVVEGRGACQHTGVCGDTWEVHLLKRHSQINYIVVLYTNANLQ